MGKQFGDPGDGPVGDAGQNVLKPAEGIHIAASTGSDEAPQNSGSLTADLCRGPVPPQLCPHPSLSVPPRSASSPAPHWTKHRSSRSHGASGVSDAATSLRLNRRALHRAVRTEYAAVTRLRPKQGLASAALVEKLACVRRHGFLAGSSAVRTDQHGLQNDGGRSHGLAAP